MDWSFSVAFLVEFITFLHSSTYIYPRDSYTSLATIISSFIVTRIEIETTYEYNHFMYSHTHYILI